MSLRLPTTNMEELAHIVNIHAPTHALRAPTFTLMSMNRTVFTGLARPLIQCGGVLRWVSPDSTLAPYSIRGFRSRSFDLLSDWDLTDRCMVLLSLRISIEWTGVLPPIPIK
ncbi:hypothetical protein QAD02_017901 [Eretmocerus hayati]|uniref:Uncharacterized protein n=1 Tax=Eretmocerus hayati TaxID=131215 RepID=A0ACC2PFN0_9HYME|nr:hypothetical protein QAD02_017901 [Eretmocerus hayati]